MSKFRFSAAALFLFGWQAAHAMINSQFTPVHLVAQSDVILQLRAIPGHTNGWVTFSVDRVLKGTEETKELSVNFAAALPPDRVDAIVRALKDATEVPALMFIAAWPEKPGDTLGTDEAATRTAFVHLNGMWLVLKQNKTTWTLEKESAVLLGTWNGGSDMLLRAVQYILDDSDAEVPVETSAKWGTVHNLGRVSGKISGMAAVDLTGNGIPLLFVASDAGDQIYTLAGNKPVSLTTQLKLTSKSLLFAWGDFTGDGLLDLASWDGKALSLYLQNKDGTFAPPSTGAKTLPECLALTTLDIGNAAGKAGLLISTRTVPLLLAPGTDAVPYAVTGGEWPGKELGRVYPCLVADFDNDGLPDIVQPMAKGGLFYKGKAPGVFSAPVSCPVAGGDGAGVACIGNWEGSGKLDIFIPGSDTFRLWTNRGGGDFANVAHLTGELSYNAKSAEIGACLCDLNNDGRQGILILYSSGVPKAFFSRGFRSFGVSYSLDMGSGEILPGIDNGQVAGCMADFTGDGTEALAVALTNGVCAVVTRGPAGAEQCARTVLSPKAGKAGPVRLCATAGKRVLGAWNLTAGATPAFVTRTEAGSIRLTWQFPGKSEEAKEIILENKPRTVVIGEATEQHN